MIADLLAYEERHGLRTRKRKAGDDAAMRGAVRVIVANLAHMVLFAPERGGTGLILPAAHARGRPAEKPYAGFGEALPGLLESLHALGVLLLTKPKISRLATTVAPTAAMRARVLAEGITGTDIGREIVAERLVRLSRREGERRTYFPVPNTAEAHQHQADMSRINHALAGASLAYLGNDPVDVGDRLLVRRFSHPREVDLPCLDYGGRLCGGWWQNMPRRHRAYIRIDGEPVAELDYGQMVPRLAYGMADEALPEDVDLYDLPGLGERRDGVKQGVNALLWGARRWSPNIASALPRECTASALRNTLLLRRPGLAQALHMGRLGGYRLMHRESAVMVAVLLACIAVGITALPIHDAVLVPVSAADTVARIMSDAAIAVAGVPIPVTMKGEKEWRAA